MSERHTVQVIARIRSDFPTKFGIPRQSGLVEELAQQGLLYAEIRFAPQLHLQKGLTQEQVVRAVMKLLVRARSAISSKRAVLPMPRWPMRSRARSRFPGCFDRPVAKSSMTLSRPTMRSGRLPKEGRKID